MIRALLLLLAVASVGVVIACGGDDNSGASLSPVGTKSGAPTAAPETTAANGGVAPDAIDPTLDQELHEITHGEQLLDLAPGESFSFDSQALAQETGTTPNCTNFQFDFTWQVRAPYPPDGVDFQWQIERNGNKVKVADGGNGEQSVGCDTVDALNNGADAITVAVKYKIGGL